jgi:hypothetical protein
MLNICVSVANTLSLQFSSSKSQCMYICKMCNFIFESMSLGEAVISRVSSIEYLDITLSRSRS